MKAFPDVYVVAQAPKGDDFFVVLSHHKTLKQAEKALQKDFKFDQKNGDCWNYRIEKHSSEVVWKGKTPKK